MSPRTVLGVLTGLAVTTALVGAATVAVLAEMPYEEEIEE